MSRPYEANYMYANFPCGCCLSRTVIRKVRPLQISTRSKFLHELSLVPSQDLIYCSFNCVTILSLLVKVN